MCVAVGGRGAEGRERRALASRGVSLTELEGEAAGRYYSSLTSPTSPGTGGRRREEGGSRREEEGGGGRRREQEKEWTEIGRASCRERVSSPV